MTQRPDEVGDGEESAKKEWHAASQTVVCEKSLLVPKGSSSWVNATVRRGGNQAVSPERATPSLGSAGRRQANGRGAGWRCFCMPCVGERLMRMRATSASRMSRMSRMLWCRGVVVSWCPVDGVAGFLRRRPGGGRSGAQTGEVLPPDGRRPGGPWRRVQRGSSRGRTGRAARRREDEKTTTGRGAAERTEEDALSPSQTFSLCSLSLSHVSDSLQGTREKNARAPTQTGRAVDAGSASQTGRRRCKAGQTGGRPSLTLAGPSLFSAVLSHLLSQVLRFLPSARPAILLSRRGHAKGGGGGEPCPAAAGPCALP